MIVEPKVKIYVLQSEVREHLSDIFDKCEKTSGRGCVILIDDSDHISVKNILGRYKTPSSLNNRNKIGLIKCLLFFFKC